jgi:hypothetical protein
MKGLPVRQTNHSNERVGTSCVINDNSIQSSGAECVRCGVWRSGSNESDPGRDGKPSSPGTGASRNNNCIASTCRMGWTIDKRIHVALIAGCGCIGTSVCCWYECAQKKRKEDRFCYSRYHLWTVVGDPIRFANDLVNRVCTQITI